MHRWNDDLDRASREAISARTTAIGRELFAQFRQDRHRPWERAWWDDRLMAWAMRDEWLKVELFRFVDVLPMLRTDAEVASHLDEYLSSVPSGLPWWLRGALAASRHFAPARRVLAWAARVGTSDFARRFIAGSNTAEVLAAAQRERKAGRSFTLDILGEAVISEREADTYFQAYVDLIEQVAPEVNRWPEVAQVDRGVTGPLPRFNLSIKLSALDCHFDPIDPEGVMERAGRRFRDLLRVARQHGAFLNVDMESYEKKGLTLEVFERVLMEDEFREVGDVGIVVQCYLHDAPRDLERLAEWSARRGKPVWVRLVKGAYWDYETVHARAHGWPIPVFQRKWQSDAMFERATRFVLQNHALLRPAIASHNVRSVAHGLAVAEHLGLPRNGLEVQMLYGMADMMKRALAAQGYRVRVYMPYGELIPGMAYLVRRLLENTSDDSFLRAGMLEGASADELLQDPLDLAALLPPLEIGPPVAGGK